MKHISIALVFIFSSCNSPTALETYKVDTHDSINRLGKEVEHKKTTPVANIYELEMEVNNGGVKPIFYQFIWKKLLRNINTFKEEREI